MTAADVLEAFDRWNDGNPGPAYGRVVLYAAGEITLEQLVRAVLEDQDLDTEEWRRYVYVVCRAFEEWLRAQEPTYTIQDWLDSIFTLEELLSLSDDELCQLEELEGDVRLEAVWWRRRRAKEASSDAPA